MKKDPMRNNIRIGSFFIKNAKNRAAGAARETNTHAVKTISFPFSQDSHTNLCLFTPNSQALR